MNKLEVGDLVHTNMYNVYISEFDSVGGLTGIVKDVQPNGMFSVYVDLDKYPFYNTGGSKSNSYVWCYKNGGHREYYVNKLNNTNDLYQIY